MSKSIASKTAKGVTKKVKALKTTSKIPMSKGNPGKNKRVTKGVAGEVKICPTCDAVSNIKRWETAPVLHAVYAKDKSVERALCPGCQRVKEKYIDGIVELNGEVIAKKAKDIKGLIENILSYARSDDPANHIVSMKGTGNKLTISTTTVWLAETIGKAIRRQYKGHLEIHFGHGEEFVRVYWEQK
jgi:NMD protein affecting ribosome stability and mRNA decay